MEDSKRPLPLQNRLRWTVDLCAPDNQLRETCGADATMLVQPELLPYTLANRGIGKIWTVTATA